MRVLTILIAVSLFSTSLNAEVLSCHGESIKQKQFGDLGTVVYGESITLEEVLQGALRSLSKEAQILSRVQSLPNKADSYVQDAIALLDGPSGLYSCFSSNLQPKDIIVKFKESGGSETRTGFVIMRAHKPVAYLYESIVNI